MLWSVSCTNSLNPFLYSAKLRARQKERIAQGHNSEVLNSADKTELPRDSQITSVKEAHSLDASKHLDDAGEDVSALNLGETKLTQPFESKRSNSTAKVRRFSKYGYRRYHSTRLDLSVKPSGNLSPDIFLPSHQLLSGASANPAPSAHLLPVLGLCAPNASQMNSVTRKSHSILTQPLSDHEQRKANTGMSEIPFPVPACSGPSNDLNIGGRKPAGDPSLFPDISEASRRRMKNILPDNFFPFVSVCFTLFIPSYFYIRHAYLPQFKSSCRRILT